MRHSWKARCHNECQNHEYVDEYFHALIIGILLYFANVLKTLLQCLSELSFNFESAEFYSQYQFAAHYAEVLSWERVGQGGLDIKRTGSFFEWLPVLLVQSYFS